MIDRDGKIYQLVRLDTICRHTVGLNWTAFGIEHVGRSDAADPRQPGAALGIPVTDALADEHGTSIQLRDVIGHSESLTSPYHHERYRAWRCQTHGDWLHADMQVYRTALARLAHRSGVPLGPPARRVPPRCR